LKPSYPTDIKTGVLVPSNSVLCFCQTGLMRDECFTWFRTSLRLLISFESV